MLSQFRLGYCFGLTVNLRGFSWFCDGESGIFLNGFWIVIFLKLDKKN
jgi:hypothetical protein